MSFPSDDAEAWEPPTVPPTPTPPTPEPVLDVVRAIVADARDEVRQMPPETVDVSPAERKRLEFLLYRLERQRGSSPDASGNVTH